MRKYNQPQIIAESHLGPLMLIYCAAQQNLFWIRLKFPQTWVLYELRWEPTRLPSLPSAEARSSGWLSAGTSSQLCPGPWRPWEAAPDPPPVPQDCRWKIIREERDAHQMTEGGSSRRSRVRPGPSSGSRSVRWSLSPQLQCVQAFLPTQSMLHSHFVCHLRGCDVNLGVLGGALFCQRHQISTMRYILRSHTHSYFDTGAASSSFCFLAPAAPCSWAASWTWDWREYSRRWRRHRLVAFLDVAPLVGTQTSSLEEEW